MAGAYPGHLKEPEHSQLIHCLIDKANITTFLCLQTSKELKRFTPYQEIALEKKSTIQFLHFPIQGTIYNATPIAVWAFRS